ncbi:MAG: hypothetical protein MO852_02160 [Candidatus Devosia euplotis]|nr:hypothetical protein [Candidatus Devosia euplotis]
MAVIAVLVIGLLIAAEQRTRHDRVYLGRRDSRVPPAREYLAAPPPAAGWPSGSA